MRVLVSLMIASLLVSGCGSVSHRISMAQKLADRAKLEKQLIKTNGFALTTFSRVSNLNLPVNIYIEGDGLSWVTPNQVSQNPTPINPVALQLASEDGAENVIYIARPCQFTDFSDDALCSKKYWTSAGFSDLVITSVNDAINTLTYNNKQPKNLIGYSGGAAVAALVASRREDVTSLRSVAGNLDHRAITDYHQATPLYDSLNPIDVAGKLEHIAQYHFIGEDDKVVPKFVAEKFVRKSAGENGCAKISSVSGVDHYQGWKEHWKYLLRQPINCTKS